MADTQNITQRHTRDTNDDPMDNKKNNMMRSRREKRMGMAKRGIRSLAIAVAVPFFLTLSNIYLFGSSSYRRAAYAGHPKPFWFPPLWILQVTSLASTFLMSLAAWLVWAEGGMHKNPTAFPLYLCQFALSLYWDLIAFGFGAPWLGLVMCVGMFGALAGCSRQFKAVNPIAGDLVRPCLAWAAFLAVVNLKLLFV